MIPAQEVEIGDYGLVFYTDDRGRQVIGEYDDDILACETDPKFAAVGPNGCKMCPATSEPCSVHRAGDDDENGSGECSGPLMLVVGPDGVDRACEPYEVSSIPEAHRALLRYSNHHRASGMSGIYCVQLIPEIAPCRLKFGFASDFTSRLRNFKISCPNARLVSTWDGNTSMESSLLNYLRHEAGHETWIGWVGGEVFDALVELDQILSKAGSFIERISAPRQS